jgi:hypothetical protein
VEFRQDDVVVDRQQFKDCPKISDKYHQLAEVVDGFSRRCRWRQLGSGGSVISGPSECSRRRKLKFDATEVLKPCK